MDPGYTGPEFDFDRIVKDLMNKVRRIINTSLFQQMIINGTKEDKGKKQFKQTFQGIRRKSSVQDTFSMQTNINSIFANLMQVRDFVYFLLPDL